MDAMLRLLAIISVPIGLVIGWKLSPYFISSLDKFAHSRYEIWLKKLGIAIGWGFVPAFILWNLGGGDVFNKRGHSADMPANVVVARNSEKILPSSGIVNGVMSNGVNSSVSAEVNLPELSGTSEQIDNAVSDELNVDKIVAEKRASLLRAHPACAEILKQEEVNPGDNDLQCANFEFETADKELNGTYKLVRASLPDERKAALKSEQVAWIKDKESFCEGAANRSMSMNPRFREAATNFCLAEITQKRTEYLKSLR